MNLMRSWHIFKPDAQPSKNINQRKNIMAEQVELEVTPREITGKSTKKLRRAGIIPANISGHNQDSEAVQIDAVTFARLLREHKTTGIFALKQQGSATQNALIRHVQHEPKSGHILHIDFFR
ncbi:MAG TPA: hypothetical protein DHW02_05700, partial [Ktedonobacter sp.]|nr:hypothetical protein [Ktedonobacter sp.]